MPRVRILQTSEKSNEQILQDRRYTVTASRADQDGCKIIDAATRQNPDHIFGDKLLHIRIEAVEGTETGQQNHIRGDLISTYRNGENGADITTEHPASGEFRNRAVQPLIDGHCGAAGCDIPEYPEHVRPRVHIGDAAMRQRQLETPLSAAADREVLKLRTQINGARTAAH